VIAQRLAIVEEHYNEKIARIVGNMLDYDYTERMDLVEMSIYINRELNRGENSDEKYKESKVSGKDNKESRVSSKDVGETKSCSSRGIMTKSRMLNSRTGEKALK
jgi:hypothetical protein